jgi:hypothetical protein
VIKTSRSVGTFLSYPILQKKRKKEGKVGFGCEELGARGASGEEADAEVSVSGGCLRNEAEIRWSCDGLHVMILVTELGGRGAERRD